MLCDNYILSNRSRWTFYFSKVFNLILQSAEKIFWLFEDLSMDGTLSDKFNDFEENSDVLYYTSMFFFDYLIEQKGINKETNFFNCNSFIKKAQDLIDDEGYAGDIIAYEYDHGVYDD